MVPIPDGCVLSGLSRAVYLLLCTVLGRGNRLTQDETRPPRPQVSEIRCKRNSPIHDRMVPVSTKQTPFATNGQQEILSITSPMHMLLITREFLKLWAIFQVRVAGNVASP
jgi:hypothetical protein